MNSMLLILPKFHNFENEIAEEISSLGFKLIVSVLYSGFPEVYVRGLAPSVRELSSNVDNGGDSPCVTYSEDSGHKP